MILKFYFNRILFFVVYSLIIASCSSNEVESNNQQEDDNSEESQGAQPPNILLIIADDFGLDACPGYNLGDNKANMPNLQVQINNGITFNNVWSNPTCSPTRAGILTGRHGFRNGVTKASHTLSTSEISIQKFLDNNTNSAYSHAVIGKWHLGRTDSHPNDMGVSYFAGTNSNVSSYFDWTLNINGITSNTTEYLTSKLTNLAIDWVDKQTKPWFLWLAYNAPHGPFHLPPDNLHSKGVLATDQTTINNNPTPYYQAALEALDTEMGRLINSMSQEEKDNTVIIFIGDNGTPGRVAQAYNSRRAKGTVYQGGVNVPMIVSGKGVTRINDSENALINTLDIFATIADIANTGTNEIHDSKSFKNLFSSTSNTFKDYAFTEILNDENTKDITIRNTTHKYILFGDGTEALFNLNDNPLETPNLMHTNQLPLSESDNTIKNTLVLELQNYMN